MLEITDGPSPAPPNGPGASYLGRWTISFDSSRMIRPLKPLAISTRLTIDTTDPANAIVTDCQEGGPTLNAISSYYTFIIDNTTHTQKPPSLFTVSGQDILISLGGIHVNGGQAWYWDSPWGLALFRMKIRADAAETVTQKLLYVDDAAYFYLNGVKFDSYYTGGAPASKTITWNFVPGINTVEIVVENSGGYFAALDLYGDFFVSHPNLHFVP